ncbi:MAG: hypothetical protein KDJ52_00060 [Anaerolineae bacterium]|nr:hypothetical protein [Anaerolineae bacterium]
MVNHIVAQTPSPSKKKSGAALHLPPYPIPQRKGQFVPIGSDPCRRLLAAVALLAVTDIIRPPKTLSKTDRSSARDFIETYPDIYRALGVPYKKLKHIISAKQKG